jgi:hypothetical protein
MPEEWPFASPTGDHAPPRGFKQPQDFLTARGSEGAEAVIVRIGLNDAQLVLIDGKGFWDRWVYHSVEEAAEAAEGLGIDVHTGEYPEKTRVRVNAYQRPKNDIDKAPYPEQGAVGALIPYPENRPRELQEPHLKALREKKQKEQS